MVHALRKALTDEGIGLLNNETVEHTHRGTAISIVGLVEYETGFEDGLQGLLRSPRPRIVLVHEPEVAECLPPHSADLVLAGHTHGGQIAVPFLTRWIVRRGCGSKYVAGHYQINGNPLYINRGLGCTGYPVRIRAAPELTIFRLVR